MMEIVLLGTGAATPTLHRWPTSTAVLLDGEILLFDCGEGTQVQFLKAKLRPGKLSRIFISHFHGDHFYGLIGILTSLQLAGRQTPLYLYGPAGLREHIRQMRALSQFRPGYELHISEIEPSATGKTWEMEGYTVAARPLRHRIFTAGFRLEENSRPGKFDVEKAVALGVPDGPLRRRLQAGESIEIAGGRRVSPGEIIGPSRPGRKLAICLDTAPCGNAVALAKDVDVLIHDGTFAGGMEERAAETGHSTVAQAAQVARDAGAARLIVTHISARYGAGDEAALLEEARTIFPNAGIAADLMRVTVAPGIAGI